MIDKTKIEIPGVTDSVAPAVKVEAPVAEKPVVTAPEPQEKVSVEELQKQIADLKKMVEATADRNKLEDFQEKSKDKNAKTVNVSLYNGKIVLAWSKLLTNTVKKVNGTWKEDQTTELTYQDDTKEVVNYNTWQNMKQMVPALVENTVTSSTGQISYNVSTESYGNFSINQTFIN